MSTSSQLKEKYRKSSRLSLHDCDEGTAARTRPFSYEEIVLRRKYKHLSEDVEDAVIEAELTSTEGIVKNASHGIESERSKQYYKDSSPIGENLPSDKPAKTSSRKRKRHISASAACEDVIKGNDSQVIELEPKLQDRQDKYMNKEVKVGKTNTESHGERKHGNYGTNDNRSEVERKLSDYSKGKKSHAYQSGGKYEKEIKRKYLNGDAEKCEDRSAAKKSDAGRHGLDISHRNERVTSLKSRIEVSRKYQNRGYEASDDKSAAKKRDPDGCHDLNDLRRKDRKELSKSHTEILSKYQSRDDKKREDRNAANKRDPGRHYDLDNSGRKDRKEISKSNVGESTKYRNGDDGKLDRGSAAKKYELERHFNLDISGRKERKESSKLRVDESKLGRRRSRSRGHTEGNEKSSSLSPRSHKRTSHEKGEHTEFSSHISKDRSKRQLSDVDRSRVLNNGSNSHHWRHGESSNRLGGYSPRKRISEAAAKTPSPPYRSPEKKSAKWDLPPAENLSVSVSSTFQSSKSTVSSKVYDSISSVHVASITMEPLPRFSGSASITKKFASIDSIQLTQSTRHMRRLYLEEIPSSTSEKVLLECLNNLFLSSGVNHVEGAQPCISCIINKEKRQALVEFLTPEDASAALSFDGISISGSIVKIRRPKDYVEVATGDPERSIAAVDAISDVVMDSPNKIFIGGISRALSPKMLLEIVSAFGPVKAYHFEVSEDLSGPCAFLEYVDQSVTAKACAGLNGMKLGGKILTVVQEIHSAMSSESTGQSLYDVPEHAKPLLKQPTQVLKLKNVIEIEDRGLLCEQEVEDIMADMRLECARFGAVKSIEVVKQLNSATSNGALEIVHSTESPFLQKIIALAENQTKADAMEGRMHEELTGISGIVMLSNVEEHKIGEAASGGYMDDDCQTGELDTDKSMEAHNREKTPGTDQVPVELPNLQNSPKENNDRVTDSISVDDSHLKIKSMAETLDEADMKRQETFAQQDGSMRTESDATVKGDIKEQDCNLDSIFELGCVFVEFKRTEASCMAAHFLHGRVFDGRTVMVDYISLDHYKRRFSK